MISDPNILLIDSNKLSGPPLRHESSRRPSQIEDTDDRAEIETYFSALILKLASLGTLVNVTFSTAQ